MKIIVLILNWFLRKSKYHVVHKRARHYKPTAIHVPEFAPLTAQVLTDNTELHPFEDLPHTYTVVKEDIKGNPSSGTGVWTSP